MYDGNLVFDIADVPNNLLYTIFAIFCGGDGIDREGFSGRLQLHQPRSGCLRQNSLMHMLYSLLRSVKGLRRLCVFIDLGMLLQDSSREQAAHTCFVTDDSTSIRFAKASV